MRLALAALAICCAACASCAYDAQTRSEDTRAIYRAFLASYSEGQMKLNVANRTTELRLDNDDKQCVETLGLESTTISTTHPLPADLSPNALLVDADEHQRQMVDPMANIQRGQTVEQAVGDAFDNGLLRLSEIAFDRAHKYAVFEYSFACGSLCGNGATVIYERTASGWTRSSRHCAEWIS